MILRGALVKARWLVLSTPRRLGRGFLDLPDPPYLDALSALTLIAWGQFLVWHPNLLSTHPESYYVLANILNEPDWIIMTQVVGVAQLIVWTKGGRWSRVLLGLLAGFLWASLGVGILKANRNAAGLVTYFAFSTINAWVVLLLCRRHRRHPE